MSTLDANAYRLNIKSIKAHTIDKTPDERLALIGTLAIITNVPIIIVGTYIGELYGFNEKLNNQIQRWKDFYQITSVINIKPDDTPGMQI